MVHCKHCGRAVRLNQIVRSAYHDLGCVHCFGKETGETPIMYAERIAARRPESQPFTLRRVGG